MSLRIGTNVAANGSLAALQRNSLAVSKSLERLSSGLRINQASDDAAGLEISQTMRAQVTGSKQAMANAQQGMNLIQTADGALAQITSLLQRMRDLAVQASNGTLTSSDRTALQAELTQDISQVDNIAKYTAFNGKALLDGTFGTETLQVGADNGQTLAVTINGMDSKSLGLSTTSTPATFSTPVANLGITTGSFNAIVNGSTYSVNVNAGDTLSNVFTSIFFAASSVAAIGGIVAADGTVEFGAAGATSLSFSDGTSNFASATSLTAGTGGSYNSLFMFFTAGAPTTVTTGGISIATQSSATQAISTLDTALATVDTQRASLGATENQLGYIVQNLSIGAENQAAAQSRLQDVDFAKEMSHFTREAILVRSATAMVAQANNNAHLVLKLIS